MTTRLATRYGVVGRKESAVCPRIAASVTMTTPQKVTSAVMPRPAIRASAGLMSAGGGGGARGGVGADGGADSVT
jgi:hypothetical protein